MKIARAPDAGLAPATRRRRWILPFWLTAALGAAGAAAYLNTGDSAVDVEITEASSIFPSQALTLFNATGYVVPQTKADVASKATGRLESLEVEEGAVVTKGQVLARIENRDVLAALNQAAANVELARTDLKRAEAELTEAGLMLRRSSALLERKFVSRELYDAQVARHAKAKAAVNNAKAAIAAAEAAYQGAQVAVDYTSIKAPFDGVILSKHADVGDILAPFSSTTLSKGSVVSMADLNTLEVEADVSESNLSQIGIGQPCEIQLDALPKERFRCAVDRIVPTVDRTKATVLVKVRFVDKDERILPDMSAKVAFLSRELAPEQSRPVTAVPAAAVVSRGGADTIFLVRDKRAWAMTIESDERIADFVVVKDGVHPGDRIVLRPSERVRDGAPIQSSGL